MTEAGVSDEGASGEGVSSGSLPVPPLPRTAWLAIDLDALVSNFAAFRDELAPRTRVDPVVKGDAYGHGSVPVARALADAGAASFCVATYDEALELRQGGIREPIFIVYPIPPELAPNAARHRFSVTVGDSTLLERTLAALCEAERRSRRLEIQVEVESGLGRGGLHPQDLPAAVEAIRRHPRARLGGLWSHLQAANDASRSAGQTDEFERASGLLEQAGSTLPRRHLAASGGVLGSAVPPYDAVRLGLSLYGIVPDRLPVAADRASLAARLRPVMSLRARPVRVTWLQAQTGVSYGPSFVTSRDSAIATLPVGYADGYPRSLSNRSSAIVRGCRVPVVGTVAMDAIMVDVTGVPGDPITVDDEFVLLGRQGEAEIDATEVAQWGNTISYEIVTAMSRRLPRVYYAAGATVAIRTLADERGGSPQRRRTRARAGT